MKDISRLHFLKFPQMSICQHQKHFVPYLHKSSQEVLRYKYI
jgi:hypothetical protein